MDERSKKQLFWSCFAALMATSFGFMLRGMLIGEWANEFKLTEVQKGEIFGVGLWPFALSITLFSLIIDRIGYGKSMIFALTCHLASVIITLLANGYWMLYIGTLIFALGNGAIEASINPIVASMFSSEKTKWMNILHAGWPGGMVVGGIIAIIMGKDIEWRVKMGIILVPMIIYGFLMMGKKFPVHERVKAGVSYREMLAELGIGGGLLITSLIVFQLGNVFSWPLYVNISLIIVIVGAFGIYVRSLGQPLFLILLLIMLPLAITELGTDSWIIDLMTPEMEKLNLQAGWVLVYTALIMTITRLFAGTFLKIFNPFGLLILCSLIAVFGLLFLSFSTGIMIFVAATIYGFGKSYFWPTMIGIVGERFPKGGALILNVVTATGMIAVGIIGAVFLGFVQVKEIDRKLAAENPVLHSKYLLIEKESILGNYKALDETLINAAEPEEKLILQTLKETSKKDALKIVAILPSGMFVFYLLLWLYFKRKGGYKPIGIEH